MTETTALAETERVEVCPLCQGAAAEDMFESGDWLYQVPGTFLLTRCATCELVYLRVRPTAQSLPSYYPDSSYYAYHGRVSHSLFQQHSLLARVWYWVKRSVLAQEHGYSHLRGSRVAALFAKAPGLAPLRHRATFALEALLHPLVEGGSLLDVGCGAGEYLDLMRSLGWRRTCGVDFSSRAVAEACDGLGLEVYCGELTSVGFDDDSFDAVSLSHTLEHVADPVGLLSEIRRVLKPGGRLAIAVPNVASLCSRLFRDYWLGLDPPRHLANYSPATVALAIEKSGLAVERITTSTGGAYQMALFSQSRRAGDPHGVYTDASHRFPAQRRVRARFIAANERGLCRLGARVGEEVMAVARKPQL